MCCKCCSVRQQKIWVFTLGSLFLVLGILMICLWPGMIRTILDKQLPLTPTSKTYEKWKITPIPVYMQMTLWNWTNPDEVRDLNVKPNFVPMGPYVFREQNMKEDIVWNPNQTVTYYGKRTWFFEPDMSNGTLEDEVTCPHVPSVAVVNSLRNHNKLVKAFVNTLLNSEGGMLSITKTADEWLFKGYLDSFLDFCVKLNNPAIPIDSPYFGLFIGRNGTKEFEGTYTVHTGQGDLNQMGVLTHWNGRTHTGYFDGDCGKVNGSTGDLWVPNRPADEPITMFVPDTCRFINLYPGEKVRKLGIDGVKYGINELTFDSGDRYPNMKCFCSPESNECAKTGVIDLGPCTEGAPMYLSHNHFYLADPSYSEQITGMAPDPEKHTYYIVMEPTLGIPLEVSADVMVSLRIRSDDDFTIFRGIRDDFYAPFFTTAQRAELSKSLAMELRFALGLPYYGLYTGIALTAIGAVMLVIGTSLTIAQKWRGQQELLSKGEM